MTTDLTKPVQIRDGRKARIICTDRAKHEYPVLALIGYDDGEESIFCYNLLGKHAVDRAFDLINIDTTPKNFAEIATLRAKLDHATNLGMRYSKDAIKLREALREKQS